MITRAKLLFDLIGPRTLARFDARCRHPMQEQEKLLRALLHENADTAFGRRHEFASIDSLSAFQKRVPLTEYEDIEPYVEAARRGHPAQLTRARPVFYAMTSGTTGPAKYIPVTEASRHAKAGLMRLWLSATLRDHPSVLDGAILQPASPEIEVRAPDGTPCGSEGGHAYRNMPKVMRGMYPVPYEVCEIPDYAARYYTLLRVALMHPVRVIGTPNPSTILLLARELSA
ncbi:MAG TPA: GH3 auxin-responsive promoter family protein, partial [Polyangia bacterium]